MNQEMEKVMHDHEERRENDRGFFVLARIQEALCCDKTKIMEFWTGLMGFAFQGFFLLLNITAFPPADVRFLLRQLWLTDRRLGWLLLGMGLCQSLATATKSHDLRGWLAVLAAILAGMIALAYLLVGAQPYFLAWVAFLGLVVVEIWLLYRNFKDGKREENVRHFVMRRHGLTDEAIK